MVVAAADLIDGGTGDDMLNGGTGDNADTIIGGAGNDTINLDNGNDGNDIIRFTASGFGNDVINGFDANAAGGQDMIDLSALGITADNFASRVTLAPGDGPDVGDTIVTVRNADGTTAGTIRIDGVAAGAGSQLSQADFILAPTAPPVFGIHGTMGRMPSPETGPPTPSTASAATTSSMALAVTTS